MKFVVVSWRAAGLLARAALLTALAVPLSPVARAEDSGASQTAAQPKPTQPKTLWEQDTLLGDAWGFRTKAADAGVQIGLQYTLDLLGNVNGGVRRSFIGEGVIAPTLDIDLGKFTEIGALSSTSFHASAFQVHGRSITLHNTGALALATNIEQVATTRLFEAWVEQKFLGDMVALRIGQMAVDTEFLIAPTAATFINNSFYYPTWMAFDLPNGGPATPLSSPGARLKVTPTDKITFLAGIYSADPAGRGRLLYPAPFNNAEYKNRHGTTFNFNYGTLYMGEAAYADAKAPLPFAYKLGGWFVAGGRFLDQRFDPFGAPLADASTSIGTARRYGSDWGVYAIADQALWVPGGDDPRKISAFLRGGASPSDRNLISGYGDGGVTFTGFVPSRPNDVFGIAGTYSRISSRARGFDMDTRFFNADPFFPTRDYEFVAEATYQLVLAPWLTVQADAQHFWHPGGHVLAASGPRAGRVIGDETVLLLRTVVKF